METLDTYGLRRISTDLSTAAWLVIGGLVLVALEVRVGRFDLLNPVVGLGLVAYAFHRLLDTGPPGAVAGSLGRARAVAIGGLLVVAVSELVAPHTTGGIGPDALVIPTGELTLLILRVVAETATLLAVAWAFGAVARWAGLERARGSWRRSRRLLLVLLVPAVVIALLLIPLHRAGTLTVTDQPVLSLVLVAAMLLPAIHVLVSLVRTSREAHAWRAAAVEE